MTLLPAAADTTFTHVVTPRHLDEMAAWMAPAARLAIDIEADSLYHYYEKICLVQLTVRGRNFVVDPLALQDLTPLVTALAGRTLILHGADYDLRMLRTAYHFRPQAGVIDTMLAARLLGIQAFGLSALVERFFGRTLSKSGQKADWSHRPLKPSQLQYAVDDTRYLEPLADRLLEELDRLGRRSWFEEGCEAAVEATAGDRPPEPDREWRVKGVRDLTRSQARFVQELWKWREEEARQADRPPFKILGNDRLLELAVWAEQHPRAALAQAPKLPRDFRAARLESLSKVIHQAAQLAPSEWPDPRVRSEGRRRSPGQGFNRLREGLARLAADLGLEPPVIAPRSALEAISRHPPADVEAIQRIGGLQRWQAELLAPLVRSGLA